MRKNNREMDKINEIYDKLENNKKKYQELMSKGNSVENAVKFNAVLNKRMEKLGIKTCKYIPKESEDGQQN